MNITVGYIKNVSTQKVSKFNVCFLKYAHFSQDLSLFQTMNHETTIIKTRDHKGKYFECRKIDINETST